MTTGRPAHRRAALLLLALIPPALVSDGASAQARGSVVLDREVVTTAIVQVKRALPRGWESHTIRWETVPAGWKGDSTCVLLEVRDTTCRLPHPSGELFYNPFYRLWFVPTGWEGRMEITVIGGESEGATYLGENLDFRVLYRTLGGNTWRDGVDGFVDALELEAFPVSHRPQHTLDVDAMQRLYQRLDTATGGRSGRWQRQIYGIADLGSTLYLELLTWDTRGVGSESPADPTYLGELAERETEYLARQALAAFPEKRTLYLRRVTEKSFGDVMIVNPRLLAMPSR
jgi:hypothetical protein